MAKEEIADGYMRFEGMVMPASIARSLMAQRRWRISRIMKANPGMTKDEAREIVRHNDQQGVVVHGKV